MPTDNRSGLNVGALIHGGAALATREVLALLHDVCGHPGTAFPQTPEDLWLTSTGELLIAQPDQPVTPTDPRTAVANLLETMLPVDDRDPARTVPESLRGLPARLRAASGGVGPQDRIDLRSILSWHLGGDAGEIIRQLMERVTHREAGAISAAVAVEAAAAPAALEELPAPSAAAEEVVAAPGAMSVRGPSRVYDDLDLYAGHVEAPWAPAPAEPPPPPRAVLGSLVSALAVGTLFVAIGSAIGAASYWVFRDRAGDRRAAIELREAPRVAAAEQVAPSPTATDAAPAVVEMNPTASAGAPDARPAPLQLSVADGAFSPTFATSGRELFFHAGRSNAGRLLVASLDDSGQVSRVSALLDERARNYHPRVSPDGQLLAFDSDRGGERAVYVSERDGTNPQRVSGNGYGAVPSWSPDMQWLAFVRGEAARPRVWNLWLRDLSSGALQRHTSFRSGQVWGASWFPDGQSLCYSHEDRLVISHLDAREDIVIDTPRRGRLVRTPAVSPDGRRVVFQVFTDGVWLLDVQTRQLQRILDDPSAEEFSWAPDGRRIAYHSRRDGAWKIWLMNVPE